ncbi:MAG: ChaN family lipoprotein [Gammaproteobacteria bacterium]|nr:ChaN family lipoprotein [Gammaproteobacteria bacterium]
MSKKHRLQVGSERFYSGVIAMRQTARKSGRFHTLWLLAGLALLWLTGCATSSVPPMATGDHPLLGRIWDVEAGAFMNEATLLNKLRGAEYLLLGEQHDNLVHHQHQTWIIQQLALSHHQVSVSFEMIDDAQGKLLADHAAENVETLIGMLDQFSNHWNYTLNYQALFRAVLSEGYQIMPANLNRQRLREIVTQGEDMLPAAYKKMLSMAGLTPAQMKNLRAEVAQSHCGMLDDEMVQRMVLAQRVRDAVIAHSLSKSQLPLKVLIAGSGHVRKDRGVPQYLASLDRDARIVSLGFAEVVSEDRDADHYALHWGADRLPFDYVWFTPGVERGNLCAAFTDI